MVVNTASNDKYTEEAIKVKMVSKRRWFVLISGYFIMFLVNGFPFNMSIIITELLRAFGKSRAETALVQSVTTGILNIAARKTGISGSLLATVGLVLSFLATDIPYLIVMIGVFSGLGFSACFISALTSVGEYFEGGSKLMALAFLTFASGCGSIMIPFILELLIEEFGWRGCLLIIGGLMANMVCFFAICKPVSVGIPHTCTIDNQSAEKNSGRKPNKDVFLNSLRSLIRNKVYIIHVVAMCFIIPVINSVSIFMIDFFTTKHFDLRSSTILYMCIQIGFTLVGPVPGLMKKFIPHISVLHIPALFTALGASVIAILPHADTFVEYVVLLICLGMSQGVGVTTVTMATMKLVGIHNYSAGLGVLMTIMGFSNSIAGPITGWLIDQAGSYTEAFYGISASLAFSTCLYLLASILKHNTKEKIENETDSTTPLFLMKISS